MTALRRQAAMRAMPAAPVYAVTPFTLLDFPGRTACIVWFSGCAMRCGYCHNPQIVRSKGRCSQDRVLSFLESRRGLLDGVVLSGGEATQHPGLADFTRRVKDMGFALKLDTNGIRPETVARLLADGLLDYVALDYKAPHQKFHAVTQSKNWPAFERTLSLLIRQSAIDYEIRTTVHTALLDEDDINRIIAHLETLQYRGIYYVQNFRHDPQGATLGGLPPQARILNRDALAAPRGFTIRYRNF